MSDRTNDKPLQLPIISIKRIPGYAITNVNRRTLTYRGSGAQKSDEKTAVLNAIPITLSYRIEVYARYYQEADAYMRNIVFNIINYPHLQTEIPYDDITLLHNVNIRVVTDVTDDSSNSERLTPGQFTKLSVGINMDDAYLFDVRIRNNISVTADVKMVEEHSDLYSLSDVIVEEDD